MPIHHSKPLCWDSACPLFELQPLRNSFFFLFFLLVVFLAFALAYFIFPWPLIRDLLQQVQKPRRFSFFQLLYLYCKLRIGNMHEDDKLHNRRIQSFRGSKNHHAAILWSAYLHAIFRQADI